MTPKNHAITKPFRGGYRFIAEVKQMPTPSRAPVLLRGRPLQGPFMNQRRRFARRGPGPKGG